MSIVLVGGMDRLGDKYRKEARELGVDLHIFSQPEQGMKRKIGRADAVVIFTNKVSHQARHDAFGTAKKCGVPVFMHHSCGVCTLRECLHCLCVALQPGREECTAEKNEGTVGRVTPNSGRC